MRTVKLKKNYWLFVPFILMSVIVINTWVAWKVIKLVDPIQHVTRAHDIIKNGVSATLWDRYLYPEEGGIPILQKPPLYRLFLAAILIVFGLEYVNLIAVILQLFLFMISIMLVAKSFFDNETALLAVSLTFLISPLPALYNTPLPTTYAAIFSFLSIYFFRKNKVLFSIFLTLAEYTHLHAVVFVTIFIIFLLLKDRKQLKYALIPLILFTPFLTFIWINRAYLAPIGLDKSSTPIPWWLIITFIISSFSMVFKEKREEIQILALLPISGLLFYLTTGHISRSFFITYILLSFFLAKILKKRKKYLNYVSLGVWILLVTNPFNMNKHSIFHQIQQDKKQLNEVMIETINRGIVTPFQEEGAIIAKIARPNETVYCSRYAEPIYMFSGRNVTGGSLTIDIFQFNLNKKKNYQRVNYIIYGEEIPQECKQVAKLYYGIVCTFED